MSSGAPATGDLASPLLSTPGGGCSGAFAKSDPRCVGTGIADASGEGLPGPGLPAHAGQAEAVPVGETGGEVVSGEQEHVQEQVQEHPTTKLPPPQTLTDHDTRGKGVPSLGIPSVGTHAYASSRYPLNTYSSPGGGEGEGEGEGGRGEGRAVVLATRMAPSTTCV